MKNIFTGIYVNHGWGQGSGEGSLPENTEIYRQFLEQFIRDKEIKSVIDYGCGDWQFSRLVNWGNVQYLGLDVVDSLIDNHNKTYRSNNIQFQSLDGIPDELPDADLILIKDVLQHWPNQTIISFIPKIEKYKFALITNCINPEDATDNHDIHEGDFHYLDLTKPPFSYNMYKVLEYTNREAVTDVNQLRWKKIVLLLEHKI
ncbi:class I SAM-dependent methyltransferase [Ilyomonas limi]|uniref:Class I SAM-dependent methyltransferase n=1 Tax=Ilyomonas limi TaxID=2575867 RepID=A0A4V5UUN9_9BACT|nr:class I SAM-dependent methyltransferase [Ilyomonas limi]TKK69873.1 class I SAM-dependent methyltransferase [Ilyomonas limi]